jgi:hypothetical protein
MRKPELTCIIAATSVPIVLLIPTAKNSVNASEPK